MPMHMAIALLAAQGEIDHGLTAAGQVLIILTHAAGATNPGDCPLHYPSPRQSFKGLGQRHPDQPRVFGRDPAAPRRPLYPLTGPLHVLFNPAFADARVTLIDPHFLQARELALDRLEQEGHTLAILEIGGMHHHLEQQTHRVHEQMTLAPAHFLAAVIAMRASTLRRFDRLAVNDAGTRRRLAP